MRYLTATLLLLLLATPAAAIDLHVAPHGRDGNPGTEDRPLRTLLGARDAIRALKAKGPLREAVTVHVADGRYALEDPLVLQSEDSGGAAAPITYRAAEGAHPVFSGGRKIDGWRRGADGVWTAQIPEVADGSWYFEQLFVDGRRATRARSPNEFYYYMQEVVQRKLDDGSGRSAQQTVRMRDSAFQEALGDVDDDALEDVNLVVYHKWDNTRRFLDRIDRDRSVLVTSGREMKSWNPWRRNTRFHLENYRAALDAPGEWFLSRDGTLHYYPLEGEDPTALEFVAPVTEKFIVIEGDAAADRLVEHVTIRGLHFEHGQWITPPGGFEPSQAASPVDAVVLVDGARNVTIEDCRFGHVGRYGVWFRKGCTQCTLRRCHLHDLGAGGVRIGETRIASDERERTGQIVVDNNIIRHGGYIFPCAVGAWIGQSGDNKLTHNEIADFYYTGISAGWRWGYAGSLAKRNEIAWNHVHHIGWGVLSDMGGIYTLGPSEGTVVRNNVFHDIHAYSYGGWGLYTDEGSTGILFEKNLVYDVKTGGFHQHYGKQNIVRNNILAFSELHQLQATRVEDHLSFTLENNIVYWDQGSLLSGPWERVRFESRKNCYWQADEAPFDFAGHSLAQWQEMGHEQGTRIVDPDFADPDGDDFRLADDSPVFELGFERFDYTKAGVYGDESWIRLAREVEYPPLKIAPDPPPLSFDEGFEHMPVGQAPTGGDVHAEDHPEAIVVTTETAAEGDQSVKLTDGPQLEKSFNPHLVYSRLNYQRRFIDNRFYLRVGSAADCVFEWRDYSGSGYQTGPQLRIGQGRLTLPGGKSISLAPDQWVHFEILAAVAGPGNVKWSLRVTPQGGQAIVLDDLPVVSDKFGQLTWVGLMSVGRQEAVTYLDEFRLESRAIDDDRLESDSVPVPRWSTK